MEPNLVFSGKSWKALKLGKELMGKVKLTRFKKRGFVRVTNCQTQENNNERERGTFQPTGQGDQKPNPKRMGGSKMPQIPPKGANKNLEKGSWDPRPLPKFKNNWEPPVKSLVEE